MNNCHDIPISTLREMLRCDPDTGKLFWLERGDVPAQWNTRYAGKEAFTSLSNGYPYGTIHRKSVAAHRVIWALCHGEWPEGEIDHINGKPSDNRIVNLRLATRTDQNRNCKLQGNNSSGCTGVFWHKSGRKWTAQIRHDGRAIHLGMYDTKAEAVAARKAAAKVAGYHPNHGERA